MAKPLTQRQELRRSKSMLLNMHKKCDDIYECNTDAIKRAIEVQVNRIDEKLGLESTFELEEE